MTVKEGVRIPAQRATERIADFTRAMSHLKPRERAMLWLAYAEGASHGEIADVLDVPTVRVPLAAEGGVLHDPVRLGEALRSLLL